MRPGAEAVIWKEPGSDSLVDLVQPPKEAGGNWDLPLGTDISSIHFGELILSWRHCCWQALSWNSPSSLLEQVSGLAYQPVSIVLGSPRPSSQPHGDIMPPSIRPVAAVDPLLKTPQLPQDLAMSNRGPRIGSHQTVASISSGRPILSTSNQKLQH